MEMDQYLDMFLEESQEHLQSINDQLLRLEKDPTSLAIVNEIFRSAHTLKGMAATMEFEHITELTHSMENVLDNLRQRKTVVTTEVLDLLLEAVEALEGMILSISEGGEGKQTIRPLINKLHEIGGIGEVAATKDVLHTVEQVQIGVQLPVLDEYERTVVDQSIEQGFIPYYITIVLDRGCVLKAARTFMIFEVLESLGEVVKVDPPVEMLEEEKFEFEFSLILLTKTSSDDIRHQIMKVSEIEHVAISEYSLTKIEETDSNENERSIEPKRSISSQTIRVNLERLDQLMNLFEELVIDRGRLEEIAYTLKNPDLTETVERITRVSGDLQNIILTLRMVPIEQVFNRFPRMVRGIARDLNKQVHLEIIGAETELDRTVIDEIGDPLVHLLRNSLDHGIELPSVREQFNKPAEGLVTLRAYQSGNNVFIEIEDDGAGINRTNVLEKAISNGLLTASEAEHLTDEEIFQYIFSSGFSTAKEVSDLSGRGVGLDVVKSKIESLGGHVSVLSQEGKGSRFVIQLPLTLSIVAALLVDVGSEKYAIPLSSIVETLIVKKDDVKFVHNQEVIDFRGSVVPLIDLGETFQIEREEERKDEYHSLVIVRKGDKLAALIVDSFIGQQEVVLKPLGNYLADVFAISGGTILGDGQVALVIDCHALIK